MQFMMLIYETKEDFESRATEQPSALTGAWRAYYKALIDAGIYVGGAPLEAPSTGSDGARAWRAAARAGRALRGYQRTAWRADRSRVAVDGRSARLGGALSDGRQRRG